MNALHHDDWAARLAKLWVRFYTRGLAPDIRDARRSEISSDIFEQQSVGVRDGHTRHQSLILGRTLRGVTSDLAWRRDERYAMSQTQPAAAGGQRVSLRTALARQLRWLAVVPLIVAAPILFFGIMWISVVQVVFGATLVLTAVALWRIFAGEWPIRWAQRS